MKFERQFAGSLSSAILAMAVLLGISRGTCVAAEKELWVYCPANFLVEAECTRVHKIMQRAAMAGYTHVLLADSKFSRLAEMDQRYFKHIAELKSKAASLNLMLVPTCFPVGYSNDILALNPNLAEALPVRESPYRVEGNRAIHQSDPNVALPPLAERNKWGFIDDVFVAAGDGLVAQAPFGPHARVMKSFKPQRFQQYHASVWIKTEDFTSQVEIKVLDGQGNNLSYTYLNAKPTQDWTEHHVTFNSLDNAQLNFYIGAWGPRTGKLWIRDPKLESTGAVNLVRRPTAPIRVQYISDGRTTDLKESEDFEPWADSKLGNVPYLGEYEAWHEPPPIELKRKLPPGSELRVSYYHTHIIHESQVCGSIGDEQFEKLLKQQAAAIAKLFPVDTYMMSHDEYRVMGWTKHSIPGLSSDASPGELLTHNAQVGYQTILQSNPRARVLTWSDMFDPYHNAVAKYYLVNGSLALSRLPKDVVVMNWNSGKKPQSLKHFEKLGHHQIIAGYYDEEAEQIKPWLNAVVENNLKNVDGVMYTTWKKDYSNMEAFAKLAKNHPWYQAPAETTPVNSSTPNSASANESAEKIFLSDPKLVQEHGAGEGPAWHPTLGLLTSGDGNINLRNKQGLSSVYRSNAGSNGLLFDRQGRLIVCEPGRRRVTRIELDGKTTVLAETFAGMKFNQPNDLTIDSKNRIYFTDPNYGDRSAMELIDEAGRHVEGVYRIDLDGKVTRIIAHEVDRPNGLVVSENDQFLFVAENNNSAGGARKLWRFRLTAEGSVDAKTQTLIYDWGTTRGPDGMKLDRQGRLYVAAGLNRPNPPHETADKPTAGIYVFSTAGSLLDFVNIPRDETTNCAFGEDDLKTLYVTAGGTLWSIETSTAGNPPWPSPSSK